MHIVDLIDAIDMPRARVCERRRLMRSHVARMPRCARYSHARARPRVHHSIEVFIHCECMRCTFVRTCAHHATACNDDVAHSVTSTWIDTHACRRASSRCVARNNMCEHASQHRMRCAQHMMHETKLPINEHRKYDGLKIKTKRYMNFKERKVVLFKSLITFPVQQRQSQCAIVKSHHRGGVTVSRSAQRNIKNHQL